MGYSFPSEAWFQELDRVLNTDERYAQVAKNWEGDMIVVIEADKEGEDPNLPQAIYLDLWHGKCREIKMLDRTDNLPEAAFVLAAPLRHIVSIFNGTLDPIQAMLTRRLKVKGNMAYMLRNVPTVMDFVRCCRIVGIDN